LAALDGVDAVTADRKPEGGVHSIWELVIHLTAELQHARELLKGAAVPWVEGKMTWPGLPLPSTTAWEATLRALAEANREMVQAVEALDDSVLNQQFTQVRMTYYLMLHCVIQHNVYHAGQISLLKRQLATMKLE
jgi:uncharacterized damage-inducible protein DinB